MNRPSIGAGVAALAVLGALWGYTSLKAPPGANASRQLAQAAGAPALWIQSGRPSVDYWPISGLDKTLLSFGLVNPGSEDITVTGFTFYVSSTPRSANTSSTPALLNFKLKNASSSAQYGFTIWRASAGPNPNYARVSWPTLSIRIPARGTVALVVKNDVANVSSALAPFIAGSMHEAAIVSSDPVLPASVMARGAVSGAAATVTGSVMSGMKTVYASVLHASLNPTSPNGASTPASEQVIAKFSLWHEDRGLRSPSLDRWIELRFDSNVTLRSPRTLRVYRDSVSAANLLGSVTLPASALNSQNPAFALASWTVNGTAGAPSVLLVTLDSRDAAPGNWLAARLMTLYWTDGFVHNIPRLLELPLIANYLRY